MTHAELAAITQYDGLMTAIAPLRGPALDALIAELGINHLPARATLRQKRAAVVGMYARELDSRAIERLGRGR